jgi:serine/threonine protein kinase
MPKLFVDEFPSAGEAFPMPEQESPIKGTIPIEPSSARLPPDIHAIGETRLISLISNHSAESDIWLGERANGEQVAVKIYRHGRIPGLVEESQKCALRHPNLVPVIEAGEVQGRYFEISPFVSGGTLAVLIQRRGRLAEAEVELILNQLANVVHYLHSQHVLHRDIKPTNIFIIRESPLQVALADFGTARLGAYQTLLTGTVGTVAYSSPEAVTGIQSEAADYWSLGTVLLEALTGRRPLEGLDVKQQLYRVASGKIEIPEALPARWKALLGGLLRADYTERWRKEEIERWEKASDPAEPSQTVGKQRGLTIPAARGSDDAKQPDTLEAASDMPNRPVGARSLSPVGENRTPVTREPNALLEREPETIQLTASDVAELVVNGAFRTFSRFFWLAFLVNWHGHNALGAAFLLGTAGAIGIGIDFLPHRLERVKREARVNRQLAALSHDDRRFLRRLVRSWMRSLRRESRGERRGSIRNRDRNSLISR